MKRLTLQERISYAKLVCALAREDRAAIVSAARGCLLCRGGLCRGGVLIFFLSFFLSFVLVLFAVAAGAAL